MKYAIVGSGKIGTALASIFARSHIQVGIANSRGPETLALIAEQFGQDIVPQSALDASKAEIIFLAVPFSAHNDFAKIAENWHGKTIVDVTNAMHIPAGSLGTKLSSEVVADAFSGARVVKAFNHLPAEQLGTNPSIRGQKQVVFVSSDDADASAVIAALGAELGFAPIELGRLAEGGRPLHIIDGKPGGLVLKNVAKLG